jgi:hypothetical protein
VRCHAMIIHTEIMVVHTVVLLGAVPVPAWAKSVENVS